MTKVLLRFFIRLEDHNERFSPYGPLFHRYLPEGKNDMILLDTGDSNFILKVWFERRGYVGNKMIEFDLGKFEVDPQIIPKQAILDAGPLSCLLEINGISEHEIELIRNDTIGDADFIKLGKTIVRKIEPIINNFLNIIKIKYGQYWISNLDPFDSLRNSIGSYCNSLQMECSIDDGTTWKDFRPDPLVQNATIMMGGNWNYYLSKDDWKDIKSMANEKFEPSVAMKCLLQSHHYSAEGDLKHAIVEGVTALELAIEEFFERKLTGNKTLLGKLDEFKQLHLPTKVTMVSTTLGIPSKELEDILNIIKIRNSIAHKGINAEKEFVIQRKLETLLNVVSIMVLGKKYRFPKTNSGNALKPVEMWENETT